MTLLITVALVAAALFLSTPLANRMGPAAGWPLAGLYLAAAAAFTPAAAEVFAGGEPRIAVPWIPSLGVELSFKVDGIGVVFTYIALLIGALVFAYSTTYLRRGGANVSFYLVMTTFTLAMVTLVLADDLVLLFLCWELTSLASFLLIARSGRGAETPALRALLITFVGGLTMLAAVAGIVARTGTTSVSAALANPIWNTDPAFTTAIALLIIISAATKSAQFPFHVWLPAAMAADTPVSAYLHAAAVVKAGIFLLMRFSPAFHDVPIWNLTLIAMGLFTNLLGGWLALTEPDLKKLMAYSTVSQLGLIVAAIGVGTPAALAAAVIHTIAHALFKSGLFMLVGVIDHAAHTRDLRRLPQLYRAMPWTFGVAVVGCAAMAGIPPLLGFVSKEAILTALADAPGPSWLGWTALGVAAVGALLTCMYCVKIVFGGFVDGPDIQGRQTADRPLSPTSAGLWWPTALPILAGVPLAFAIGLLDTPVARAVKAALPAAKADERLALWHGPTIELGVTAIVLVAGALIAVRRKALLLPLQRRPDREPGDLAPWLVSPLVKVGVGLDRLIAADHASRHLAAIFTTASVVIVGGVAALAHGGQLGTSTPGLDRPVDAIVLLLVIAGVALVCTSRSRIAAIVSLSAVGVVAVVQIVALGAPDVALTQLLVEALTIVVIMLIVQKLPATFARSSRKRRGKALAPALLAGFAAALATWALTGRRGPSEVAERYLNDAPGISGGRNIVNTILVEFRALDTLGELTVLGMAGVAIIAILSTVRSRDLDPERPDERIPEVPLRAEGSTAHRAMTQSWANVVPLQLLLRVVNPVLALFSLVLFLRGHNEPGGGFIAALVGSAIVGLLYLSTSRDRQIGPPRLPLALIGGGVAIAVLTGIAGLVARGSFLAPVYGHALGQHISTSMIFDLGVYLAVLGMVMVAVNLLGTSAATTLHPGGENTRERADEAVEGELPGPLDSVRGEPAPRRAGRSTAFVSSGQRPKEPGR